MKRRVHSGFTLVELLVVIAIIGILVALLLPAVQAAREAGRRSSCNNNLKQVALGMHNYHDIHKWLPAGQLNALSANSTPNVNVRMCWMQQMLPFIEQQNLYDTIQANMGLFTGSIPNVSIPIPILNCPSDGASPKNITAGATTPAASQGAHGNIVACAGSTVFGNAGQGTALNGVFYCYSRNKLASIVDGTSNTLILSEIIVVPDTSAHDLRGRYHNTWEGNNLFSTLYPPNTPVGDRSTYCIALPQAPCQSLGTTDLVQSARSYHPGGVNAAMGDGSVRFVSNTVAQNVWWAAATRNGGESLQLE